MIEDPDFRTEPVRGLPEHLPEGERILWQGSPDWRVLARRAFAVRAVALYFAALAAGAAAWSGSGPAGAALAASWFAALGAVAVGVLAFGAWLAARVSVYTVTNRRVAMRIGIALTVTINLPFSRIAAADLLVHRDGSGDIALRLTGGKLAFMMLWPHSRPWRMRRPEPAFRAIPDAAKVAAVLAGAMQAHEAERVAAEGMTGAGGAGSLAAPVQTPIAAE